MVPERSGAMPDRAARVGWVDAAKGVGILLVVFGHVWRGCAKAGLAVDAGVFEAVDRAVYLVHMPLFFALAGLFVARALETRSLMGFVRERCVHLLYAVVVWSYLSATFRWTAGRAADGSGLTGRDLLLYPLEANDIYWFLWALFLIQVALAAILALPRRRARLALCALVALSLAVIATGASVPVVGAALYYAPFLVLGHLWREAAAAPAGRTGLLGGVLFVGAESLALALPERTAGLFGLALSALAVLGAVLVVRAVHARVPGTAPVRWLARLGALSLPVYLAHVIVLGGVRTAALRLGLHDLAAQVLLGTVVATLAPLLLHRLAVRAGRAAALGFTPFPAAERSPARAGRLPAAPRGP